MSNFKPQFIIPKSKPDYWDKKPYYSFVFDTYRELKRKLAGIMKDYHVTEVSVSRSRRGEWGEWSERWYLQDDGKLVKGKEGWM